MTIYPVKASGWLSTSLSVDERGVLRHSGIVPVNDVFYPLWGHRHNILLLFGGFGSGKSVWNCQDLIEKCRTDKYFKCYYGRKIFDTVRGSCFDTLADTIEDMGLRDEFSYSRANTSSMVITHIRTGNKFIPFGSDKPDKLKSIKDPTHIWCEEFDQFDEKDFQVLLPRLRTQKAITQFVASFNTSPVHERHWVLKYFFPGLYTGDDKPDQDFIDLIESLDIHKAFANYTDNYFIDQEDYRKKLLLAAGGNPRLFEAIANGAWGVTENDKPWLYDFEYKKHVKDKVQFLPTFPVYLSFDFNNDPFGCTAYQMSPQKGGKDSFIHIIKEFSGKFKLQEMCQRIKTTFPASILYVTGDRSGQNEDLGRNQSLYKMIAGYLQISDKNMNLNTINLEHADSRYLCNTMFFHYPEFIIDKHGCPNLIKQCEMARLDDKSKKPHQLLKDREQYKMDEFDSMRYFLQTYFNEYITKTYLNALNQKMNKKLM